MDTPNIITEFGTIYLDEDGFIDSYGTVKIEDHNKIDKLITRIDLRELKEYRYAQKVCTWDSLDDKDFNLNELSYWDGEQTYIKANRDI